MKTVNLIDRLNFLKTTSIEADTCSRCGGTGTMPFSAFNGVCYKCRGGKIILTKRGRAANDYLLQLRSKPAAELSVGDIIRVDIFRGMSSKRGFRAIESIELVTAENAQHSLLVDGHRVPSGLGMLRVITPESDRCYKPEELVRLAQTAQQKHDTLLQALAYQDTKQGKVRK